MACDDNDPDPCTTSHGPRGSQPVACVGGADPVVLGEVAAPSSAINTEVAISNRRVVLDDTYAYWSDYAGRILRTPKAGGATDEILGPSECSIADMAVDDVGIYFGQNCLVPALQDRTNFPVEGKVAWLGKADQVRHDLASEQFTDVRQIAVNEATVYWVMSDEATASYLRSAPRDLAVPMMSGMAFSALVSSTLFLPFTLDGNGIVWWDTKGELRRSSLSGGPSSLVSPATSVESLFVSGGSIHWVENVRASSGHMERHLLGMPSGGIDPRRIFDGIVTEHVATSDGSDYYGVGYNTPDGTIVNRVYRWRAPQYEPETVAAAIEWPQSIAVDEAHVFFVDQSMSDPFTLRLIRVTR
jgi:hypothetical protein